MMNIAADRGDRLGMRGDWFRSLRRVGMAGGFDFGAGATVPNPAVYAYARVARAGAGIGLWKLFAPAVNRIGLQWETKTARWTGGFPALFRLAMRRLTPLPASYALERDGTNNALTAGNVHRAGARQAIIALWEACVAWRHAAHPAGFQVSNNPTALLPVGAALYPFVAGETWPTAWDGYGNSVARLTAGFAGLSRWVDAVIPGSWVTFARPDVCLPGTWSWGSSLREAGLPVFSAWGVIGRTAVISLLDLYGHETRTLRGAPYRLDWRPPYAGQVPAAWDTWARQYLANGPQARWSIDVATRAALSWALTIRRGQWRDSRPGGTSAGIGGIA